MNNLVKVFCHLVFSVLLLSSTIAYAEPQFHDTFETGDLSHSENGVYYGGSTGASVSAVNKLNGSYSLRFLFRAKPLGEDSFAEQRMIYPQTNELWLKFDLYIPSNYYHRNDSPSNNKFLAIYKKDYRYPGFQVNWSLTANGQGGSNIALHRYRNGGEQRILDPEIGRNFLTSSDRGKWINIIARVKAPSSATASDGIMQMWKNGDLVTNETSLDNYGGTNENYMDELYLLGWSNSGFTEETIFYLDNLSIDNEPFNRPNPPSGVIVD
ncbi:heparin lyase I family protein [Marinobacter salsuginis]